MIRDAGFTIDSDQPLTDLASDDTAPAVEVTVGRTATLKTLTQLRPSRMVGQGA